MGEASAQCGGHRADRVGWGTIAEEGPVPRSINFVNSGAVELKNKRGGGGGEVQEGEWRQSKGRWWGATGLRKEGGAIGVVGKVATGPYTGRVGMCAARPRKERGAECAAGPRT